MKQDDGVSGWQWHQLDHIPVQTIQTDNNTNTLSLNFYRPDAFSWRPPTNSVKSKHWRHSVANVNNNNKVGYLVAANHDDNNNSRAVTDLNFVDDFPRGCSFFVPDLHLVQVQLVSFLQHHIVLGLQCLEVLPFLHLPQDTRAEQQTCTPP